MLTDLIIINLSINHQFNLREKSLLMSKSFLELAIYLARLSNIHAHVERKLNFILTALVKSSDKCAWWRKLLTEKNLSKNLSF